MDLIDIGRILDVAPHKPHFSFDMFGVSTIDFEDVTLYDTCTNAMDMIGEDAALPRLRYVFDTFGISMLEINDDDGLIATYIIHNIVYVEAASDSVDPPLSFDTMFRFVTRFDDISYGITDMSIFKYFSVSLHFPLITPPAHIYDADDVGDTDDPLGGKSKCDSNIEDRKVTPIIGNT